ncbi:MAG: hypothetical protein ACLQDQ_06040 [Myxococcaceae bacterium]
MDKDHNLIAEPKCAECGRSTARVELVPPDGRPARWSTWTGLEKKTFDQWHQSTKWRFLYEGPGGGNGLGADIAEAEAALYASAFGEPLEFERIRTAELHDHAGYCVLCGQPYCQAHWKTSATGGARCPRGHFASLDPHWVPAESD